MDLDIKSSLLEKIMYNLYILIEMWLYIVLVLITGIFQKIHKIRKDWFIFFLLRLW